MNPVEHQKVVKPFAVMASIAVLLTAGLVPAFADNASQAPFAPTNLNATPLSSDQISLTWNSPLNATQSGIIGYQIQQNGQVLVNNTGNTLTNYNDTSLLPGSIEQYQVAAWNPVGLGLFSNNASATTPVPSTQTTVNTTQIITQEPVNMTSHIFRGNWTSYFTQHHGYSGSQTGNQTLPYERMHVGQFVNGTGNQFNWQQNGTYHPVHTSSQTVSNPVHQWIQHAGQYQVHQAPVVQQFKNLNKDAQIWHNHVSADMIDHHIAKSTDKHQFPHQMTVKKQWAH
ncbi:MAG: fibronectin type III domain-containing protein [Nitrosotalea sp.]